MGDERPTVREVGTSSGKVRQARPGAA